VAHPSTVEERVCDMTQQVEKPQSSAEVADNAEKQGSPRRMQRARRRHFSLLTMSAAAHGSGVALGCRKGITNYNLVSRASRNLRS
jgi:hypothetical protein